MTINFKKLTHYLSHHRIERFLNATSNSEENAELLYRRNVKLAQSFYPILNLFEIFLRNAINNVVSDHLDDETWVISQKDEFMAHHSLERSNYYLKRQVENAIRDISSTGRVVTPGKVIAEQSFGFWTSLFQNHHYRLIQGAPIRCFANKPREENRSSIEGHLKQIRIFRNRVYHNEPICFNMHHVDFTPAVEINSLIISMLSWIDEDLASYVHSYNSVEEVIRSFD